MGGLVSWVVNEIREVVNIDEKKGLVRVRNPAQHHVLLEAEKNCLGLMRQEGMEPLRNAVSFGVWKGESHD